MSNWMERVCSDPEFSPPFSDARHELLYAVYELCAASDAGGLVSYFTSDAAVYFLDVTAWLDKHKIDSSWVNSVQEAFGGRIPVETERRVERLTGLDDWADGVDPFEAAQREFDNARPLIDSAMNKEVAA